MGPIVALFSSVRLTEICQLAVDDFVVDDGVPIILIRGDDDDETKRVKTEAGVRFVPVHPELPAGSTGYRSDPFSKYFTRFRWPLSGNYDLMTASPSGRASAEPLIPQSEAIVQTCVNGVGAAFLALFWLHRRR